MLAGIYLWIDALLIFPYRQPENPVTGFFLGTLFLCLICVIIGEITTICLHRFNRKYYRRLNRETVRMHNLSIKAILVKDKENYTACNRRANEAFGRYFFARIGIGAAALWPVPFALGWMQYRFHDIALGVPFRIPGIGDSVGYAFVLITGYILVRICFARIRPVLTGFLRLDAGGTKNEGNEKMVGWAEVERCGGFPDHQLREKAAEKGVGK